MVLDVNFVSPRRQIMPRQALLVPVSDSALGQIVRRKLERNPIPRHDFDAIPAESPGHGSQHWHARVEFDREHPSPEFFDNFTHYFNSVFFWQIILQFFWLFE
jgi:hypothetical protein